MKNKALTIPIVAAVLVIVSFVGAQKISIAYSSRTSSYDYRIVTDGAKQYLEMRQTGKQRWSRVEDVTCIHGPGRYASESFDHVTICQ